MINIKTVIYQLLATFFIAITIVACDKENDEFDDFTEQNVYFPIQYPLRTINLSEDSYTDNSIDLERAFSIGVAIGGLRENNSDRIINIRMAPELTEDLVFANGDTIKMMPNSYFSMSNSDQITIPAGSMSGTVRVQLTDAFFNDPNSIVRNYVIPLVIEDGNYDVIRGTPSVDNPDRLVSSDWVAGEEPRDYTLFAVKYINKYDGTYLHFGEEQVLDTLGAVAATNTYNATEITDNFLTDVGTLNLNMVQVNRMGQNTGGKYKMNLTISDTGDINISTADGGFEVTGTGAFYTRDESNALSWGGEKRKTLVIDYEYVDADGNTHRASDTLVFRNDNIVFEEFTPTAPADGGDG